MKKVLSVALASAMVLGMGANAFAISYSTGSNNEADWPTDFQFDGELFVTDKDGDIIEESTTELNDNEAVDFEPGDVIWMPLYADDQYAYDADYKEGTDDLDAVSNIKLGADYFNEGSVEETSTKVYYYHTNGSWYDDANFTNVENPVADGYTIAPEEPAAGFEHGKGYAWTKVDSANTPAELLEIPATIDVVNGDSTVTRTVSSAKAVVNGKTFKASKPSQFATLIQNVNDELQAMSDAGKSALIKDVTVTVTLEAVEGTDDYIGKPVIVEGDEVIVDGVLNDEVTVDYGHYTGNIDKNWSINLIEKSTGVAELIEKAELYKATATDYASYSKYTDEIMPNAVYLKITLKDTWKTVDEETLTYYVYIADNDSKSKTNEVWVSGTYANNDWEYVDFDWTNDASKATLWKVKKGENGTAVFDFADKAFFTVKMYSGESMYLDLSTAYDKAIAGEMDAEADSFYKFDNDNANFSRTGELIIVTDDETLVPYEIDEDGNFVEVDAKYVEDYAIAHTNKKVDGFVFSTKTLGNYVLSTEELGQEEQPAEETPAKPVTPSEPTTETPSTSKPNPETGAEDFVGLAVSLAVVSVAAAGALALKK